MPESAPTLSVTLRSTPSSPQVGATVMMRGQVTPAASGITVLLQVEGKGGVWTTVRNVPTNSSGHYVGSMALGAGGVRHLRARVLSSANNGSTSSPTSTLTVLAKPSKGNAFTAPLPVMSGRLQVGEKLTVKPGAWKPTPTNLSYRWLRDGAAISKATSTTYVLTSLDQDRFITVEARASRRSQPTARESVNYTPVAKGAITPAQVTIAGTPLVGSALAAGSAGWVPAPTSVTYQWTRGQKPISGATARTYVPSHPDAGAQVAVVVVAQRPGYANAAASSAPVTVVEPVTPTPTPTPTSNSSPNSDARTRADAGPRPTSGTHPRTDARSHSLTRANPNSDADTHTDARHPSRLPRPHRRPNPSRLPRPDAHAGANPGTDVLTRADSHAGADVRTDADLGGDARSRTHTDANARTNI